MSEYVKKNPIGGFKPALKHDCSHVILTVEEYDQLLQEKEKAERDVIAARDEVNQKRREIERIQWKIQTDTEAAISRPMRHWLLQKLKLNISGFSTKTY